MENKNQYQAMLRGKVASAILQARMAAGLTHQGVKGQVLEILLGELFRPLLPSDIGVGTGQIIESYSGRMSRQIDIVIYNKSILPPVLIDGNTGLFPIESVLYTIEVKTTLNSKELSLAHKSAKDLNTKFGYLPGLKNPEGKIVDHKIEKLRSVVFALNTTLKKNGMTEAARYKKTINGDNRYLAAICVAGREYSYEELDCWNTIRDTENYDEILAFIGGISNTYKDVSQSRGFPLLGLYMIPDMKNIITLPFTNLPELTVTCNKCAKIKKIICKFDTLNFVITNNTISDTTPCECGGEFYSEKGNYVIKGGRLREITLLNQKDASSAD